MRDKGLYLVFDSGTTNTKAFLFDGEARLIASASHPTATLWPRPGWVEQRAETWWDAAVKAARTLRRSTPRWSGNKISAIGISSQGGTFAPLNRNLKPLRPGITWLDHRSAAFAAGLVKRYGSGFLYRKSGRRMAGWAPPAAVLWMKETEPPLYAGISRLSFVADYLNFKLTGRFFLDPTSAQMTCFYNLRKDDWDDEVLEISGLKRAALPDLVNAYETGGTVTREAAKLLDIRPGTPVVAGGHDQYCASLGTGATGEGDCLLSCGTAWALLVSCRKLVFDEKSAWAPGRHLRENTFGLMGAIGNGGVILDWVRKNIRIPPHRGLPRQGGGEAGVKMTPFFSQSKGTIENLSLATTGADIYRAALEAVIGEVRNYLEQLKGRIPVRRFVLAGGGVREPQLVPMLKKITGKQVVVPEIREAAARGAALLAVQRKT